MCNQSGWKGVKFTTLDIPRVAAGVSPGAQVQFVKWDGAIVWTENLLSVIWAKTAITLFWLKPSESDAAGPFNHASGF